VDAWAWVEQIWRGSRAKMLWKGRQVVVSSLCKPEGEDLWLGVPAC